MATKKSTDVVPAAQSAEPISGSEPNEAITTGTALTVVETAADKFAAAMPPAAAAQTEDVKANMEKVMKTAEEFVSFGQGNLEAFAKSGQIWATGVQDLGKHVAATAQAQMEQTVATFKALAGVKSLKEAIDLQSSLARSSMEKAMADTGKLTDASIKLAEQAMAPITARVTLAMEKFGKTV